MISTRNRKLTLLSSKKHAYTTEPSSFVCTCSLSYLRGRGGKSLEPRYCRQAQAGTCLN